MQTVEARDITVVIPTVFRPPTFQPLCDSVAGSGAALRVIERRKLHEAWNAGLMEAETRYVIIANDDIVVMQADGDHAPPWVTKFARHFSEGDTWVAATPFLGMHRMTQPPVAAMMIRDLGGHWRGVAPMHRGHLFGVDREADCTPVPEELVLAFGDDWFFWRHRLHGVTCLATDVSFATGHAVPALGTPRSESGWTHGHKDFEAFLGCPVKDRLEADRVAARFVFNFREDETTGLREMYASA